MSAFVVLADGGSERVLMGHLNPEAHWDHFGALDAERAHVHSNGWMLPSSHLLLYESPQEAGRRILREQLGLEELQLSEAAVVAEVGTPRRFPGLPKHWDFEFIFKGTVDDGVPPQNDLCRELRFVDPTVTKKGEVARSHDEVLENAGFSFLASTYLIQMLLPECETGRFCGKA